MRKSNWNEGENEIGQKQPRIQPRSCMAAPTAHLQLHTYVCSGVLKVKIIMSGKRRTGGV